MEKIVFHSGAPGKSPFGFPGARGRRRASHSLKGSDRGTEANFCCTYFGPRLPPPCLCSLSHRQLLLSDRESPPCLHSPHQRRLRNAQEGKTGLLVASVPRFRVQSGVLAAGLSFSHLHQPLDAVLGAVRPTPWLGSFCPTCSFSACQNCSTLSVRPGRRLSIHLEVGEAPSRARIVTTGAEEREVRGSLGCPSAPPASSEARSAQPSPAALLGTAVLTSPALPPAPQRSGSGGGWGAASEDAGGNVSARVYTRACSPPGWGPMGTAAGSEIRAPSKAVLRGYCEQLGALASQLGLSLVETRRNRLR